MITVKIEGVEQLKRKFSGLEKQVRFAASVALNNTAKNIGNAQRAEIAGVFDRPKAQTTKATYVQRSTKTNLTAIIGLKSRANGVPAAEYLAPNIRGGARAYKRSEFMLTQAGILPSGMFTVPGAGARFDAYGNMSRGQINQILSFFRTFGNSSLNTSRMNMTDKRRAALSNKNMEYFVARPGDKSKLHPGVWQRKGSGITPVLMFVTRAVYKTIYGFDTVAAKVVRTTFQREFDKAIEYAIRTAR